MIWLLFDSCLSEINQYKPLCHCGILLPEQEECNMSSLVNISIDELKHILLTYCLIYYQRGTLKVVLDGRSIFMMDNDLQNNYFDKFNIIQFNYHQRNIYYIGVGTLRDNIINPSSQFFNYSCPRKSRSLINKFKKKCDRMKMLLKINVMLQDDLVDTLKIINNKVSSNQFFQNE